MCARTIYCTNIDKKVVLTSTFTIIVFKSMCLKIDTKYEALMQVTQADVKLFFESICGEVC